MLDDAGIAVIVRDGVEAGETLKRLAYLLDKPYNTIYRIAVQSGLYTKPRMSCRQRKELLRLVDEGKSQSEIARRLGVNRSTVCRALRNELHEDPEEDDSDEDLVEFRKVAPYTCPTCRKRVSVEPCVSCYARG